jgi:NAD(P)-dependent dehydrogenase (short-subunit alcohol dehydrogenase family)
LEASNLRIVITGASRGLGLEFASQYAADGHTVFALARKPEECGLVELAARHGDRLRAIPCDVVDVAAVAAAVAEVGSNEAAIDLLINNAGIAGVTGGQFGDLDYDDMRRVFEINTIAPVRMSEQCLPLLRAGKNPRVVHVTSRMGSIADNESGGWWAYRMSKVALNMACKNMTFELRESSVATMVIHPGWVRTDMGGGGASLSVEESVSGMRDVIADLDLSQTGAFRDYTGAALPW